MTEHIDVSRWPAPIEGEDQEQLKIMLSGKPYIADEPYLNRIRESIASKMFEYNAERSNEKRKVLMENTFTMRKPEGRPQNATILPPFTFEYVSLAFSEVCRELICQGYNISIGYDVYVAPNAQFIDVNESKSPSSQLNNAGSAILKSQSTSVTEPC